jgi:DNA gyrase subunit A
MSIVIDLKRDANAQVTLNQLYSFSQLQETVGVIMLALVNGQPKTLTLKEMLQHYIDFQGQVVTRRTQYDLKKAQERAHILEGLLIAQDNIDEMVDIFKTSKTTPIAKERLIERFGLSQEQAQAIAEMTMSRLTGLERQRLEDELAKLNVNIAEYLAILADYARVLAIIKEELGEIRKKFGDDRRTEIQVVSGEMDIEDLIPDEKTVITLTHYGYLKSQEIDAYKAQNRGGRGIQGMSQREEDFVEEMFLANTHDYLMFFTSRGRCFRLKAYEIGQTSRASKGTNVANLLSMEGGEKITALLRVSEYDEDKYLVMLTKNGIIKRTYLSQFRNVRKSGLIALNLDEGDELCGVRLTNGEDELIIATRRGMAIRIDENDVRAVGRGARGVKAMNLAEDDSIVGIARVRENATLLTISEDGKGRRTELSGYRLQSRGGKGLTNYKTGKNALVAGIKVVDEDDDVILISDDGIIIRMPAAQITVQSRYGSGVRVMRLNGENRVVTLARSPREEESGAEGENGAATENETPNNDETES